MMLLRCVAAMAALLLAADAFAQKEIPVKVEPVVSGLYNPCGVAVRPETGEVFIADSGNLRIVKIKPGSAEEPVDVITDFPKDVYGKGPMYDIGPLGLVFLDKDTLVVGGGGKPDGEELLRIYTVPEDGKTIKADDMKMSLGPIGPGEESVKGEGNFYALAVIDKAIYITTNGDDTKGWVAMANLADEEPALKPYIATKVAVEVDAPVGIAINRRNDKNQIVIGQMGEINKPKDSLLTFYSSQSGELLLNLETGLFDIAALAYSPRGRLYALDFAWMDTSQGGMFRLDGTETEAGEIGVEAVKVTELDKPTAMAFDDDGNLYITVIGTAEEGSEEKPGKLIKVTGDGKPL